MIAPVPITPEELDLLALAAAGDLDVSPDGFVSEHVREALLALLELRGDTARAAARLEALGKRAAADAVRRASGHVPGLTAEEAVHRLAARRALLRWARLGEELERSRRSDADPVTALERLERAACELLAATGHEPRQVGTLAEFAERYIASYGQVDRVVPSPFGLVNESVSGWVRGGLHLILGLTGTGKTSALVQCAMHAAELGYHVHIVSAEISGEDLVPRALGPLLSRYADDDGRPVTVARAFRRDPSVRPAVAAAVDGARDVLSRVSVDSRGGICLRDALAECVRQHALRRVDLLLVDYLQLVADGVGSSREQEVAGAARTLKAMALRHRVAVVAAAQLVDPPAWWKGEVNRSPSPAVRESRAVAHAADLIVELQPDVHGSDAHGPAQRTVPYTMRIIKCRHSVAGLERRVVFDRPSCRFIERFTNESVDREKEAIRRVPHGPQV